MDYKVQSIPKKEAHPWLIKKHYAHRLPSISYAFGLYKERIDGVCTFGTPSRQMNDGKCVFRDFTIKTLELNRLVTNEGLPKNTLSFFVGACLNLLPQPCCVVSYADHSFGHQGYIYQATNWIYTGLNQVHERKIMMGDKEIHPRTAWELAKKAGYNNTKEWVTKTDGVVQGEYTKKHRYFFFLGNKKEKREMFRRLIYPILSYPKGESKRYDASYEIKETQKSFF